MAIEIVIGDELSDWEDLIQGKRIPNTSQERRFVETIRQFAQMREVNGLLSLGRNRFEKLKGDMIGLYSSRLPSKGNKDRLIMTVDELTYVEAIQFDSKYKAKLKSKEENLVILTLLFIDNKHYKRTKRWWKTRR